MLECCICDRKFETQSSLTKHMGSHYFAGNLSEDSAEEACTIVDEQDTLMESDTNTELRKINESDLVKADPETSYRGEKTSNSEARIFQCDVCNKKYKTQGYFNKHMKTHTIIAGGSLVHDGSGIGGESAVFDNKQSELDLDQDMCRASTSASTKAESHTFNKIEKSPSETNIYPCEVCKKTYKSKEGLKKHTQIHNTAADEATEEDRAVLDEFPKLDLDGHFLFDVLESGSNSDEPPNTKEKQPPVAKCTLCKKSYRTLKGYINHTYTHAMAVISCTVPDLKVIIEQAATMTGEVLDEIQEFNSKNTTSVGKRLLEDVKILKNK